MEANPLGKMCLQETGFRRDLSPLFHWPFPSRFFLQVFLMKKSKSTFSLIYMFLLIFLDLNHVK